MLIAPVATAELEKHKYSDQRRKQQRSRAASKMLEEIAESDNPTFVRPNVELRFITQRYVDFAEYRLDPNSGDDQLLLNAVHYKKENPGLEVAVVSGDINLRNKIRTYELKPIKPLDHWELDLVEDPLVRENARLRKELGAKPELNVTFDDGQLRTEYILPCPPHNDQHVIKHALSEVQKTLKVVDPAYNPFLEVEGLNAHNRKLMEWYPKYRSFASAWLEYKQLEARTVPINLVISNVGGKTATSIRLRCSVTCDVEHVFSTSLIPEPEPPQQPVSRIKDLVHETTTPSIPWRPGVPFFNSYRSPYHPDAPEGTNIPQRIPSLNHYDSLKLSTLFLVFNDRAEAKGFSIKVTILCAEWTEPQELELHCIVNAAASSPVVSIPLSRREANDSE